MANEEKHDAAVVGFGFGGVYALHLLKQQGLDVIGLESGADVGGAWFWNRYPGARSDAESHIYRHSFDPELLQTSPWGHNYMTQPELQTYFQQIARKHDLYSNIRFNADLREATWDDSENVWRLEIQSGERFTVRYLVTAIGILHNPSIPDIPGLETFKGQITHSSRWHDGIQHEGKRVAVIGSGASGVQLVGSLGGTASELTHFVRHAQYVLPAQYRPVSTEERSLINARYDKIWNEAFTSAVAFGFTEPNRPTFSVSSEDRERIFQDLWDTGCGFRFMFGGFSDLATDEKANMEAIKFIHRKIREIVKDEQKIEVLTSKDWFARRPLTDDHYYYRFNQDNVHAVDLKKAPITAITQEGIQTSDGKLHPLDLIVFATEFDAVDGTYARINITGREGKKLKDHWADGPATHTGMQTAGFPNLFFVNGPCVVFSNQPPATEETARFAASLIAEAEAGRKKGKQGIVDSEREAEEQWLEACRTASKDTLFVKTPSWFYGENIAGKKISPRFYFGGVGRYRAALSDIKANGYTGFQFS